MLDWLDAIPNLGVPGVPGVEARKSAGYTGTPCKTAGVPGVPEGVRPANAAPATNPRATLKRWEAGLAAVPTAPPANIDPARWRCIREDAAWLFSRHGKQLAQEGWTDADVFGVSMRRPAGEVLLDRLDGSRRLHLDGKGRAAWGWSYTSVIMQTCRGYAGFQPDGAIIPLWEMK